MANQIYGYNPSAYGGSTLSNVYSSSRGGAVTDPYALSDPSLRYLSSSADTHSSASALNPSNYDLGASMYQSEALRYGGAADIGAAAGGYPGSRGIGAAAAAPTSASMPMFSQTMPWSGLDVGSGYDSVVAGMKRQNEAFYHQSVLGNHNTIGQSEALFSSNILAKRPRFETATNLPIYPQRPGEKDCTHYMLTRTCKYGESCKFDHPIWVPEGGIPDWKEVPLVPVSDSLPERPGEPDCPYFLKTQKCKFGFKCKFNHPKDKVASSNAHALATVDVSVLPERPSESPCSFYMKTGKCKFGAACKFHHPKDIQIPASDQENSNGVQTESAVKNDTAAAGDAMSVKPFVSFTPASIHNSKGLPVRLGEADCPFYLKTGSCKYGVTCRYNHPDRNAIHPPVAVGLSNAVISSSATNLNFGVINPAASILPALDPRLAQTTLGVSPTIYPQRPGQMECDFYMKNGECKFGERCKFHHPINRSAPTPSMTNQALQQNVKLTLAGLPRREGAIICPFYLKTGTCKYGVTCRFDHPPPGEAIAMAAVQGTSGSVEGEAGDKGTETTEEQQQ